MPIEPDSAQVRFPPPLVYLGFLLLGLGAERWADLRTFGVERAALWAAGAALAGGGLWLVATAIGWFRRAGTPPPPWETTTAVVTSGPYERTRNPMYVGMALIHAGLAMALDGPIALILLPVVLLVIRTQVIAREERYLERKFGPDYLAYKQRVRRWF
ncbi:methyltransferase family protein [Sphingosinicella terrae]|uniref:methyltransferase family protein n=1 Tax=Sphingosinicella terrae TaxID=2172047 RepID=UPI000E0D5DD7|nr:isoprenylcysteine carboxylmethyltransferase family protein [Sphingosinicella terrae]